MISRAWHLTINYFLKITEWKLLAKETLKKKKKGNTEVNAGSHQLSL